MAGIRICIENDRLLIRSLEERDLDGLSEIRNDPLVYRYEPVFLSELQGSIPVSSVVGYAEEYHDKPIIIK